MNGQQQQGMNIDLDQTEEIICDDCGHNTFQPTFYMRKVSAVLAGQESVIPIQIFECTRCGHVNELFIPKSNV